MIIERNKIEKFYNEFKESQIKTGVNIRHRIIMKWLVSNGLRKDLNVLEIGCGIGTVTGLIAKRVSRGNVVSVDISSESIEVAKKRNKKFKNIDFVVSDMTNFNYSLKFDMVVMPDVLEHIPFEAHGNLFKVIREHIHEKSIIMINIPSPVYQNFVTRTNPHLQQIIDLELWMDKIADSIYENGLYIDYLENYSLAYEEPDYQRMILKVKNELCEMHKLSKKNLIIKEILSRF